MGHPKSLHLVLSSTLTFNFDVKLSLGSIIHHCCHRCIIVPTTARYCIVSVFLECRTVCFSLCFDVWSFLFAAFYYCYPFRAYLFAAFLSVSNRISLCLFSVYFLQEKLARLPRSRKSYQFIIGRETMNQGGPSPPTQNTQFSTTAVSSVNIGGIPFYDNVWITAIHN